MPTERAVAARVAANPLVPDTQTVAFATGTLAATVPAHINEVFVSVANDVSGVLTIAPRPALSQLIVHMGDPGSGDVAVFYGGAPVLIADTDINSFDCVLVSTGSQMVTQLPFTALAELIRAIASSS